MSFRRWVSSLKFVNIVLLFGLAGAALLPAAAQDQDEENSSKVQIFGAYSYFAPNAKFFGTPLNSGHGYLLGTTAFLNKNIGVQVESSAHYSNNVNVAAIHGGLVARFSIADAKPFLHGEIGVVRLSPATLPSKYGISLVVGGGWDIQLYKALDLRLFQADLVYSHLNYSGIGARLSPESARLSTGLVWNFGGRAPKAAAGQ